MKNRIPKSRTIYNNYSLWETYPDEDIKELQTKIKYFKSVIEGETEIVPAYGEELDFEHSSKKIAEEEAEGRKEYIESVKKKFGVD